MALRLRRSFRGPRFLLALVAGLLSFCVQSGELGTADTMHRLQTAHSFWTNEPAVFPNEYPEFGIHGRGGKLYDWYGLGQPLLLLPADIVGAYIAKLPMFVDYDDNDPTVRNIFVTYTINTLISVLTALVCFRLLQSMGLQCDARRRRSSRVVVLHHPPALYPEHDGEQLHPVADADRNDLPVRMAA